MPQEYTDAQYLLKAWVNYRENGHPENAQGLVAQCLELRAELEDVERGMCFWDQGDPQIETLRLRHARLLRTYDACRLLTALRASGKAGPSEKAK